MDLQRFAWLPIAYLVAELVVSLWLATIVIRKKQPSVAVAWLLIIFLNAWIGLVAYTLVGDVRLGSRRLERRLAVRRRLDSGPDTGDGSKWAPEAQQDIERLTRRLGGFPAVGGNSGEMLAGTEEVIDRLIEDIDGATDHVHLLFYIFGDDTTGRRVGAALAKAVERGVECRVIVDGAGSKRMLRRLAPRLKKAGVQVVAALPVTMVRAMLSRIDLRNHRKIAVIDGRVAFTGSQNIVDADYGGKGGVGAWRDLMVRVEGPVVAQLQHVFIEDWCCETGEELDGEDFYPEADRSGPAAIQTAPSGPSHQKETFRDIVVALIAEAEERVIITSPYLIPDDQFTLALRIAVLRGVEAHVIVPKKPDQRIVGMAGRSHVQDLLETGVKVHQHTDGLLHAKTMTIDDTVALMGTANFDIRSFAINFEVSLLGYGPELTDMLRKQQLAYMRQSHEVTLEEWRQRSALQQFGDNVARLFSPLL